MSSSSSDIFTVVFHCPSQLLAAVEADLARRPKESNIVYAHAYKLSKLKQQRQSIAPNQFWIACYSRSRHGDPTGVATSVLDFVLSCTEGSLGAYPLFIYSNHPASQCTGHAFLDPRMSAIANTLLNLVSPTRVFSVFSLVSITRAFASKWTQLTGIQVVQGAPWYSATSSYCTVSTFRGSNSIRSVSVKDEPGHVLRRATMADVDEVACLCREFAATSPPFTLDTARARKEAEELIRNNQLWVYQLPALGSTPSSSPSSRTAISTIVAVTRSTPTVSAITKVYTTDAYRKRGFGERLVAHVTKELLQTDPNRSVVLYVGHMLDAVRVYERVGFVGLNPASAGKVESVEDWLELGFENTVLGHW